MPKADPAGSFYLSRFPVARMTFRSPFPARPAADRDHLKVARS